MGGTAKGATWGTNTVSPNDSFNSGAKNLWSTSYRARPGNNLTQIDDFSKPFTAE